MKSRAFIRSMLNELGKAVVVVGNTMEVTGVMFTLENVKKKHIIKGFKIHPLNAEDFMNMVKGKTFDNIFGYISHEYQSQYEALDMRVIPMIQKDPNTRQAVLIFESAHCFQSIQFLKRGDTVKVVCFMRSCDIEQKLPYDMLFLHMLGKKVAKAVGCENVTISVAFGSLHRYLDLGDCPPVPPSCRPGV